MKISIPLLVTVLLIIFLPLPVMGESLYTVRIKQVDTGQRANIPGLKKPINDLWMLKNDEGFFLNAGIFPDPRHAGLLLSQLKGIVPHATVVPASMPSRQQWLPIQQKLSLRDIGYDRPLILQGVEPYQAVHFPWDSTMETRGSYLELDLRISNVLKPDASVTILAEGVPLVSLLKQDILGAKKIKIPLDSLHHLEIGNRLDVEISGAFTASSSYCVDMKSKGLWLSLSNESCLRFTRTGPYLSARHFFSDLVNGFCFASIRKSPEIIEAVAKISGLIGSLSHAKQSRIGFDTYALTGNNIFLGAFDQDIRVVGSNIFMTPRGSELLSETVFPALIFSDITGREKTKNLKTPVKDISFEMLGYSHRTSRGMGDLVFSTGFSGLQLGGWPEKMSATIRYTHSPVLADDRSFLRVHLNGVLVESRELSGDGGERILSFNMPARAIQARNNLDLIFSYYFYTGDCMGSYPGFEVSVSKDSFLSVDRFDSEPRLNFASYPAIFKGKGALLLSGFDKSFYVPMARLMEIQGYLQRGIPDILLTDPKDFKAGNFDYGVLVMDALSAQTFSPPVDLTENLRIINPLSNKVLIDLETQDPICVLQTFYSRDKVPLLLYGQRNVPNPSREFTAAVLLSSSDANVGVISDREWHAMAVGKKIRVVYPDRKDLAYYWHKYRLIFFILAGTLFLLFLFFVYHRLAKEK